MRNVKEMIAEAQRLGSHKGFELDEAEALKEMSKDPDKKVQPYKLLVNSYDFGFAVSSDYYETELRDICRHLDTAEKELSHEIESAGSGHLGVALLMTMAALRRIKKMHNGGNK